MIVDAVFVIAIAMLNAPTDTELYSKSFVYQTRASCLIKSVELLEQVEKIKDSPEFKGKSLFVSECVAVPLVKAN